MTDTLLVCPHESATVFGSGMRRCNLCGELGDALGWYRTAPNLIEGPMTDTLPGVESTAFAFCGDCGALNVGKWAKRWRPEGKQKRRRGCHLCGYELEWKDGAVLDLSEGSRTLEAIAEALYERGVRGLTWDTIKGEEVRVISLHLAAILTPEGS